MRIQTLMALAVAGCVLAAFAQEAAATQAEVIMTQPNKDKATIATIVESVGTLADRAEFDALARLYADEFTLDYFSLNEQPASSKTPAELMAEWSSVLPGFDRTRHALSNVNVTVSGDTAQASADVVASHWIGDDFWQVEGNYEYAFTRQDGQWLITAMTFNLEDETGSRDVFGPAMAAAETKKLPGYTKQATKTHKAAKSSVDLADFARTFIAAVDRQNADDLRSFLANNVRLRMANFEPSSGVEALVTAFKATEERFSSIRHEVQGIWSGQWDGGDVVSVEAIAHYRIAKTGQEIALPVTSTLRLNELGKVADYRIFIDPAPAFADPTEKEPDMSQAGTNKATVRRFFEALQAEDAEQVANLFAPDGVHINPYHSGVFPEGAKGREAILSYWTPVFPNFDGMEFPIHEIYAMEQDRVFVRYTGRITLKGDAGLYENEYYSTFAFNDAGEITEYVEIFNPVTAAKGFGLLDQLVGS